MPSAEFSKWEGIVGVPELGKREAGLCLCPESLAVAGAILPSLLPLEFPQQRGVAYKFRLDPGSFTTLGLFSQPGPQLDQKSFH